MANWEEWYCREINQSVFIPWTITSDIYTFSFIYLNVEIKLLKTISCCIPLSFSFLFGCTCFLCRGCDWRFIEELTPDKNNWSTHVWRDKDSLLKFTGYYWKRFLQKVTIKTQSVTRILLLWYVTSAKTQSTDVRWQVNGGWGVNVLIRSSTLKNNDGKGFFKTI